MADKEKYERYVAGPSAVKLEEVAFPTDNLTIKAIREAENLKGSRFDRRSDGHFQHVEALIATERALANKAFVATLAGVKPTRAGKIMLDAARERREMMEGMDHGYQQYGLSSGPAQTVQLIRDLEAQAVAQAKEFLGKTR